jgi:two-component system response regulator PhcR
VTTDTSQPRATILYVDDEEMACKYFARAAGSEHEVLSATGADEAIAILQEHQAKISVLVTDYRMPGRDGGDLLRQVALEYPQIVRILVTAYADKDMLLETVNSGEVFKILEKPITVTDVREVLRLAGERYRERAVRQQRLMAIDETLAFLAHELNTPLAAIANFARGIEARVAGEYNQQRNAEIGRAAGAMHDNASTALRCCRRSCSPCAAARAVPSRSRVRAMTSVRGHWWHPCWIAIPLPITNVTGCKSSCTTILPCRRCRTAWRWCCRRS